MERISAHIWTERKFGASDMKIIKTFCVRTACDIFTLVVASELAAVAASVPEDDVPGIAVGMAASMRCFSMMDATFFSLKFLMTSAIFSSLLIFCSKANVFGRWLYPFQTNDCFLGVVTCETVDSSNFHEAE